MKPLNIKREVERLSNILGKAEGCLDIRELSARIQYLDQVIGQANFWKNPALGYQILQEIEYSIFYKHQKYQRWYSILEDIKAAVELLEASADEQLLQETQTNLNQLQQELETAEIRQLLTDPNDRKGSLVTITAEVSDANAQDWAYILLRMYYRWAERHNYLLYVVEESCGDVAGIKSATLEFTGRYAYGYLKSETGTHQLQRISPFDVNSKLHPSLAKVEVIPISEESVELEIPEKDLQITKWCWNGQNINSSEIWVRLVHISTGITVFCDQQRSRMENKQKALVILKIKLWALMQAQSVQQLAAIQPQPINTLSNKPIQEYILHPDKNVKDFRTEVATTSVAEVLNGEIDLFIKAYLQQQNQTVGVSKEVFNNSQ
ncbi:PCRF domain-containing protein [Nostoc sp. UHCC 0302]|uniref:PCRF domain-containing protein n=1 Tax=Nostoc sp. UHCC 0302 TaxID=3134896 RepID=UPI00311C8BB7